MLVKLNKITHRHLTLTYKRFHMNPFLTEKRKRNSYPNKTFKTSKVYEIILYKRWGTYDKKHPWNCSRLEPLNLMVCQIRFGILYCSAVFFFIVILISVSNISSSVIMKRKSHGRRNETTLYLRLKTCWKFSQKREHQTSTSLRASSLFWARREKSRESSTRKVTKVRGVRGAFSLDSLCSK